MTVTTILGIVTKDAQGYQDTLEFTVKPIAFAAAQALPTAAKIEAVINAIYGADVLSGSIVLKYFIRVEEDDPGAVGGEGDSPTSEALRIRNEIGSIGGDWLFRVPGLMKSNVTFDPTNPNSVSTSGAIMDAVRAALTDAAIAVSNPKGSYAAVPSIDLVQAATAVDGRRAPMRPR